MLGAQNLAHTAVHKGNGRVQLRRALRGHKGDGAADAGQKIGLVGGIRRKTPHYHRLAAVEHSVAGRAVAHAPAQKLGLAGHRRRFGHPAGQNQAAGVQNVTAEVDQKTVAQGHQVGHPALLGLNAKRAGVGGKGLQQGRTGQPGQAQIIVDLFRLGQQAGGSPQHPHGFAPLAQIDGG